MDEFNEAIKMIELKKSQLHARTIKVECKILVSAAIVIGSVFIGVGLTLWSMS